MPNFFVLLAVLSLSCHLYALPKASDFKDVGGDESSVAEETADATGDSAKPQLAEGESLVSGTVRVIRKLNMTEVFFKDLKDSYFIPSGGEYNSIYKACQESEKKGIAVGLKVNTKSRRILSVESSAVKGPATGSATDSKASSGAAGSK